MTLAVAVCHPPDVLRSFERHMGGEILFERAVILAADSLYSDEAGNPKYDRGLKLVQLAPNVGAVFAGNVTYTKKAIEEFKHMMSGFGSSNLDQFGRRAQSYFDAFVPENKDSACLFGIVDRDLEPHILKLTSEDRFLPHYSNSVEMIGGNNGASNMFINLLADPARLPGSTSKPGQIGLRVVDALDATIQEHYPTVGGSVQAGFVTKNRFYSIGAFEIGGVNDMRRTTLRPDETR